MSDMIDTCLMITKWSKKVYSNQDWLRIYYGYEIIMIIMKEDAVGSDADCEKKKR